MRLTLSQLRREAERLAHDGMSAADICLILDCHYLTALAAIERVNVRRTERRQ